MTDHRPKVPNIAELARDLGCDYSHLFMVLKGVQRPSPDFAMAIERATKGKIKWTVFFEVQTKPKGIV